MKLFKTPFLLIIFFCAFNTFAQETPQAVLTTTDIDLLIKTLKPIQKDLAKLGQNYDNLEDPSALQALAANEKVKAVFKKYGWSDNYFLKVSAITNAYASIKIEKEFEDMPEEQKLYMKQIIEQYKVGNKSLVNVKDLELTKSKFDALDTFFSEYHD